MKRQVIFTYDVLNYAVLPQAQAVVLHTDRVAVLGHYQQRDYEDHTEEKTERTGFQIAYEGNIYSKQGFTQADWDALVAAAQ